MIEIPISVIFDTDITDLTHSVKVRFEDNVAIHCSYQSLIVFKTLLTFVDVIPGIKINSELWIENFYTEGYPNYNTYLGLYSLIFKNYVNDIVKTTPNGEDLIPELLKQMFITIGMLPRVMKKILPKYIIGVEIQDVLEVQFRDSLLKPIADVSKNPTPDGIIDAYANLNKVITHELPKDNIIRLIYLSNMVSKGQLNQLFAPRGYLTELNSTIFKKPMTNSLTLGFKDIYEASIESRAGAKAMFLSNTAIQQSEYLARELQLVAMSVENLVFTDCGSTNYRDFLIRPKEIIDGKLFYKGDLINLIGKRYLDKDGIEKIIQKEDTHLEGTTIKMRKAMYCELADKGSICIGCYGDLGYSIFKHQNLGHLNITNTTRPVTQSILSTKHLATTASTGKVVLKDKEAMFFLIKSGDKALLHKRLFQRKTKDIRLLIPQASVYSFKDIIERNDVLNINLSKSSRINEIAIEEYSSKGSEVFDLSMRIGNRNGYFTVFFWSYLIKEGYDIDINGNFSIEMKNWDYTKPIIAYEDKEYDFTTLIRQFKTLLRTRKYYKNKLTGELQSEYTMDVLVDKLFTLLNSKLDINIALLEVLVYSFSAQDINSNNYDLPRFSPNPHPVSLKNAIDGRSFGASANWNKLATKVYDPALFTQVGKPEHILDLLFAPNEVIRDNKK